VPESYTKPRVSCAEEIFFGDNSKGFAPIYRSLV
jgi:hypothetical protein